MNDKQWLQFVQTAIKAQQEGRSTDPAWLGAALVETSGLLRAAPQRVQDAYGRIPEAQLAALGDATRDRLHDADASWPSFDETSLVEATLHVGARLRGLDAAFDDARDSYAPQDCGALKHGTPAAYVVPRRVPVVVAPGPGARNSVARRGTLRHRILPCESGSFTIELVQASGFAMIPGGQRILGAAMFNDFELETRPTGSGFRAASCRCPTSGAQIEARVASAVAASCVALVWPELTMPAEALGKLVSTLGSLAESDTPLPLSWVVTGSWHVGNPVTNCANVLDTYGRLLFSVEKTLAYADSEIGIEDIEPSFTVPVLWTDDHLVAFGICKDFCAVDAAATPFDQLGIDLVVVPSMGAESTMDAHLTVAKVLRVAGGSVFVVQQALKGAREDAATGWVLPPTASPSTLTLDAMERPSWSTHQWLD